MLLVKQLSWTVGTLHNNWRGEVMKKDSKEKLRTEEEATVTNLKLEQEFYYDSGHQDGSLYNLGDSTPLLNDEEKGAD